MYEGTKGTQAIYGKPRVRKLGNLTEMKDTQAKLEEHIGDMKAAIRDVCLILERFDDDLTGHERIKLDRLEALLIKP